MLLYKFLFVDDTVTIYQNIKIIKIHYLKLIH